MELIALALQRLRPTKDLTLRQQAALTLKDRAEWCLTYKGQPDRAYKLLKLANELYGEPPKVGRGEVLPKSFHPLVEIRSYLALIAYHHPRYGQQTPEKVEALLRSADNLFLSTMPETAPKPPNPPDNYHADERPEAFRLAGDVLYCLANLLIKQNKTTEASKSLKEAQLYYQVAFGREPNAFTRRLATQIDDLGG